MANEAGPPLAIYSEVSDLRTCTARQIHYQQHFDIPVILHRTLTSFHLNYPPYVSCSKRGPHTFSTYFLLSHIFQLSYRLHVQQTNVENLYI